MGNSKSKRQLSQTKHPRNYSGKKPFVIPQDAYPYAGPQCQYKIINTPVTIQHNATFGFSAGQQMISTNVDSYYPILCQPYNEGYKLATFYRVPGVQQQGGFFSASLNIPYQGIFSRYPDTVGPDQWQLKVVKSMIQTQQIRYGFFTNTSQSTGDTSHLHQIIFENSSIGGRLSCLELTGQTVSQGMNAAMVGFSAVMGVDLFFDMPLHPNPTMYTYQAVNVPVVVNYQMGFRCPTVTVMCDWQGHLSTYLQKGWKLVETFLDQTQQMRGAAFTSSVTLNSMWFFEKESLRLNDDTPQYQGSVVEFLHKTSAGFGGSVAKTDWTPLLQDMGQQGWQIASIMETPEITVSGLASVTMKLLFFFQRPVEFISGRYIPMGVAVPHSPVPGTMPTPPGFKCFPLSTDVDTLGLQSEKQ